MHKWQFYQDKRKGWWWRRVAPNGILVGASVEGYATKEICIMNAEMHGFVPNIQARSAELKLFREAS